MVATSSSPPSSSIGRGKGAEGGAASGPRSQLLVLLFFVVVVDDEWLTVIGWVVGKVLRGLVGLWWWLMSGWGVGEPRVWFDQRISQEGRD
jgi:hypothetical protein